MAFNDDDNDFGIGNKSSKKADKDKLEEIKYKVSDAYDAHKKNIERYNAFRRYTFDTTITDDMRAKLDAVGKPPIEVNMLEAFLSRQRGEFAENEPAVKVTNQYANQVGVETRQLVEDFMRHHILDAHNNGLQWNVMTEQMSGGFSVLKVFTEYANPMAKEQVIRWKKAYDPTRCGFDPLAVDDHKGDGGFAYEHYPKYEDDFKKQYPDVDISKLQYAGNAGDGFSWSYMLGKRKVLTMCNFFVKEAKRVKIIELTNGKIITVSQYNAFMKQWQAAGHLETPAVPTGWSRMTEIETIVQYMLVENMILKTRTTDYDMLPLIYVPGDSHRLRAEDDEALKEMSRPLVYHALGAQRLKNYAAQTEAQELDSLMQSKMKVAQESLPTQEDYLAAYQNLQQANTIIYNAYNPDNPDQPLPPPTEVVRMPIPTDILQTYSLMDQTFQNILGSPDPSLNKNSLGALSGLAQEERASGANGIAKPYIVNYMNALTRAAQMSVNLLPKYMKTPRTIPTLSLEGKREFKTINQKGSPMLNYEPNALQVDVSAGSSFAIQRKRALDALDGLMKSCPAMAQFVGTMGLDVILDNLEFRGSDILKERFPAFQKQMQQQQQQAAQQAQNQPNPAAIQAMKVQNEAKKFELDSMKFQHEVNQDIIESQFRKAEITQDAQDAAIEKARLALDAKKAHENSIVQLEKAATERAVHAAKIHLDVKDQHHTHAKEVHELALKAHEAMHKKEEKKGDKK